VLSHWCYAHLAERWITSRSYVAGGRQGRGTASATRDSISAVSANGRMMLKDYRTLDRGLDDTGYGPDIQERVSFVSGGRTCRPRWNGLRGVD
jgi:hypothetical protein